MQKCAEVQSNDTAPAVCPCRAYILYSNAQPCSKGCETFCARARRIVIVPPHSFVCSMSVSHFHDPSAASQNVGNHVGNRPCVRQSQLFRRNESGNAMKELMGQASLQWDTKRLQGAYTGAAYDPNSHRVHHIVQCQQPFSHALLGCHRCY
jgi:hypothetical protein